MEASIGIDCGNGTLKLALINSNDSVIDSVYTDNDGIIRSLKRGLKQLKKTKIIACGVTGVAKNLVSILVGADVVKSEVICHYKGTVKFIPDVKTIFEIGFQDSKITTIENNVINNFSMNSVCSAGTGQFLVNLADRLDIPIEKFSDYALKSKNPISIAGKCSVFAASSCLSKLSEGYNKEDVLMGAAKSLIRNYLALLTRGIELQPPYIFQGGVAKNLAIVRALEDELKHKVIVPEHAPIMGAIGAAMLAKEKVNGYKTNFKGFGIADYDFKTETKICKDCANRCEIVEIHQNNKIISVIGSRCGKWNR